MKKKILPTNSIIIVLNKSKENFKKLFNTLLILKSIIVRYLIIYQI